MVESVYYLFRGKFPGVELSISRRNVHMMYEGPKESLSGPLEAPAFHKTAMRPINGA